MRNRAGPHVGPAGPVDRFPAPLAGPRGRRRLVQLAMRDTTEDSEILRTIVERVLVDVVDVLVGAKAPTDEVFHY